MNKKLQTIRTRAIKIRETLSYEKTEDQKKIAKLDSIIRGTVYVKKLYLIAAVFFIAFTLVFLYLMYPDVKAMMVMLGFGVGGYAFTWFVVFIQAKIYDHAIGKMGAALTV